ncbi:hypothetical protein HBB16_10440 [Pseudonocardia sp. MCCB 268]|nr:hypothetical protein [Pseudonocardia cytotoxica]
MRPVRRRAPCRNDRAATAAGPGTDRGPARPRHAPRTSRPTSPSWTVPPTTPPAAGATARPRSFRHRLRHR